MPENNFLLEFEHNWGKGYGFAGCGLVVVGFAWFRNEDTSRVSPGFWNVLCFMAFLHNSSGQTSDVTQGVLNTDRLKVFRCCCLVGLEGLDRFV